MALVKPVDQDAVQVSEVTGLKHADAYAARGNVAEGALGGGPFELRSGLLDHR